MYTTMVNLILVLTQTLKTLVVGRLKKRRFKRILPTQLVRSYIQEKNIGGQPTFEL